MCHVTWFWCHYHPWVFVLWFLSCSVSPVGMDLLLYCFQLSNTLSVQMVGYGYLPPSSGVFWMWLKTNLTLRCQFCWGIQILINERIPESKFLKLFHILSKWLHNKKKRILQRYIIITSNLSLTFGHFLYWKIYSRCPHSSLSGRFGTQGGHITSYWPHSKGSIWHLESHIVHLFTKAECEY